MSRLHLVQETPQRIEPAAVADQLVWYWPEPVEDPVIANMSPEAAISLAIKTTQARYRRKGVSEAEITNRPAKGADAAVKEAHTDALSLLSNTSVPYELITERFSGYVPKKSIEKEQNGDATEYVIMRAMSLARKRIQRSPKERKARFEAIESTFTQKLGEQAVQHAA